VKTDYRTTETLLAEAVRTFAGSAVVVATGYVMGFRFGGGWVELLGYLLMPVIVVMVFATVVITLALRPQGRIILTWTQTACMGLAFATLIPLDRLPAVLRPLAEFQPVAPPAAAGRRSAGGKAAGRSVAGAARGAAAGRSRGGTCRSSAGRRRRWTGRR
jgi:ABC-2 type transport system permease protein